MRCALMEAQSARPCGARGAAAPARAASDLGSPSASSARRSPFDTPEHFGGARHPDMAFNSHVMLMLA